MKDDLSKIIDGCMDSEGYVLIAGTLTNKTDKDGNRILHFEYRRHRMATDDVRDTILNAKKSLINDIAISLGERESKNPEIKE